jgi:probable phosphoglycerate mutase
LSGSPARTRLYLVRHADVAEWSRGRCCGRSDVPLSPEGLERAALLGATFAGLGPEAVYSSPLRRATATADAIAAAVARRVVSLDGLAEVDFGEFEGLTFDEAARADPEVYERWMSAPATVRFPRGETYAELKERAVAAARDIVARHPGGAAAAVAHAGPIRAILCALLEIPDQAAFRVDVAYASVTLVEWVDGQPVLRRLNCG